MPEPIYGVQLFDDIHTYLPDILYNPTRFRNVAELLDYIKEQVTYISPYHRGLREFNAARQRRATLQRPVVSARIATIPINMPPSANDLLPRDQDGIWGTRNENNVFSEILGREILRSFLDTSVQVRPSNEQIISATTTTTVNIPRLQDVCSICQDGMVQNEEIRTINQCGHKFHKDCIDVWFQTNVRCPMCRHDIRENTTQSEQRPTREPTIEREAPSPSIPIRLFTNDQV